MPSYITMINWTDQGAKNFKDTVDRFNAAQEAAKAVGARFTSIYWTLGTYDLVGVLEAPDDETVTAALLAAAGGGHVRTTTMRAFGEDEMRSVIAKAG